MTARAQSRYAAAAVTLFTAVALTACSPTGGQVTTASDGSVKTICKRLINSPADALVGSPPWYRDLTTTAGREALTLPTNVQSVYDASTWLQVSHRCNHGATVRITPTGGVNIVDSIRSSDGNYVAIRVRAATTGQTTITAGHAQRNETIAITQAPTRQ